jgi:carbamoyl-phosphate synthase small subunit
VVDARIGDHGPALLTLEDGSVFPGVSWGAPIASGGDLVMNTSQSGYQEICTDPSYAGQVVLMTYPLIGNYGRLLADDQSTRPWLRGLVVAHATAAISDDAAQLAALLRAHGVPAIAGVETRSLARRLRETGAQRARISAPWESDHEAAVAATRVIATWESEDFVAQVSPAKVETYGDAGEPLVVVVDFGLKANIVRALRARGLRVRVHPHNTTIGELMHGDPVGVVLSPGPGDPARLVGPVELAGAIIATRRPLLGICLGHQITARAAGASTRRLAFGHHGANHPVRDLPSGQVYVTAQNHEVEVVAGTLPAGSGFEVSQVNLNDGSVEGLRHRDAPIETVQYHPEGSPGPLDATPVFDRFMSAIDRGKS